MVTDKGKKGLIIAGVVVGILILISVIIFFYMKNKTTAIIKSGGLFDNLFKNGKKTITNITLPYKHTFTSPLKDGMIITMKGKTKTKFERFNINFNRGEDTFFHTHFVDEWSEILRDSKINGNWERVEKKLADSAKFPLKEDTSFTLTYYVTSTGFTCYVNGAEMFTFKHRYDMKEIQYVQIKGDVMISELIIDSSKK